MLDAIRYMIVWNPLIFLAFSVLVSGRNPRGCTYDVAEAKYDAPKHISHSQLQRSMFDLSSQSVT